MNEPTGSELVALVSAFSALFISTLTLFYHFGRIAAKVQSLEEWRLSIRQDMHEVSDKLESVSNGIQSLKTLIDERTERRRELMGK